VKQNASVLACNSGRLWTMVVTTVHGRTSVPWHTCIQIRSWTMMNTIRNCWGVFVIMAPYINVQTYLL